MYRTGVVVHYDEENLTRFWYCNGCRALAYDTVFDQMTAPVDNTRPTNAKTLREWLEKHHFHNADGSCDPEVLDEVIVVLVWHDKLLMKSFK